MNGVIALVGSADFPPSLESVHRELLSATGRARPRVAILPTAAAALGEAALLRGAEEARQGFASLGAEVEPVLVRTRADADDPINAQAIGEADLVYLTHGRADYLVEVLAGSAVEQALRAAHDRGAVVAGAAAGAQALGGHRFVLRRRPWPPRWQPALALAGRAAFAPGYDALPEPLVLALLLRRPADCPVVGIDRDTALVGRDGTWQVQGRGRVTVWRGRQRSRHRQGEIICL
jgi:cyanophycinase